MKKIYILFYIFFILIISYTIDNNKKLTFIMNNNRFVFYENEDLKYYEEGIVQQGVLGENCRIHVENQIIVFKSNSKIYFYRSGKIIGGTLCYDTRINNYLFKNNTEILFYESGNVNYGTLNDNIKINGFNFLKDTIIVFYDNKKIKSGNLSDNFKFNTYEIKPNLSKGSQQTKYMTTTLLGIIIKLSIGDDEFSKIFEDGISFGNDIFFYDTGELCAGYLSNSINFNNLYFGKNNFISFYKSGKIKFGLLEKECIYHNYKLYSSISLSETGNINYSFLAERIKYGNYIANGYISFYGNEKIKEISIDNSTDCLYEGEKITGVLLDNEKNILGIKPKSKNSFFYDTFKIDLEENVSYIILSENKEINYFGSNLDSKETKKLLENNHLKIETDIIPYYPTYIFYNFKNYKEKIIKEIMFIENVDIVFENKKYNLKAFEWFKLSK